MATTTGSPEAARACAWSVGAKDNEHIWDALTAIEGELLARIQLVAEYHRAPEQRRALLAVLKRVLEPKQEAAAPVQTGPVPYSASGSFTVGQELTHVKFGKLVVTGTNGNTVDVQLNDPRSGSIRGVCRTRSCAEPADIRTPPGAGTAATAVAGFRAAARAAEP